jgi:hypothetical protein
MKTSKLVSLIKEMAKEKVNEALLGRGGSEMPRKPRYRRKMKRSLVAEDGNMNGDANTDTKKKEKVVPHTSADTITVNPEKEDLVGQSR